MPVRCKSYLHVGLMLCRRSRQYRAFKAFMRRTYTMANSYHAPWFRRQFEIFNLFPAKCIICLVRSGIA